MYKSKCGPISALSMSWKRYQIVVFSSAIAYLRFQIKLHDITPQLNIQPTLISLESTYSQTLHLMTSAFFRWLFRKSHRMNESRVEASDCVYILLLLDNYHMILVVLYLLILKLLMLPWFYGDRVMRMLSYPHQQVVGVI